MLEILSAMYDSATDTIHGCKEGSFAWWHEKGHQYLQHKKVRIYLEMIQGYSFWASLGLLICDLKSWALIIFGVATLCIAFDEVFAWIYAFKKYLGK